MLRLTKTRSLPSLEYCDDAGTKTGCRANSVVELTDPNGKSSSATSNGGKYPQTYAAGHSPPRAPA
jgi:hypothetical protein